MRHRTFPENLRPSLLVYGGLELVVPLFSFDMREGERFAPDDEEAFFAVTRRDRTRRIHTVDVYPARTAVGACFWWCSAMRVRPDGDSFVVPAIGRGGRGRGLVETAPRAYNSPAKATGVRAPRTELAGRALW
jgi:hypothetical protein